jgi:hypothetical protein
MSSTHDLSEAIVERSLAELRVAATCADQSSENEKSRVEEKAKEFLFTARPADETEQPSSNGKECLGRHESGECRRAPPHPARCGTTPDARRNKDGGEEGG